MSEMVQRVADALAIAVGRAAVNGERAGSNDLARAAIAALEPADILELMRRLSDEDRAEIMRGGGMFCRECGRADPGCQCWNDE